MAPARAALIAASQAALPAMTEAIRKASESRPKWKPNAAERKAWAANAAACGERRCRLTGASANDVAEAGLAALVAAADKSAVADA